MLPSNLNAHVNEYVLGKTWYWYLPLWLFGIYLFVALLNFDLEQNMPFLIMVPQSFDFMLHEMAHIIFGFLPAVLTAAAGSFSEIMLGTLLVGLAFRQKSYFTVMVCSLWFMLACQSAGSYMADARAQSLPLVSLGGVVAGSDQAVHDWNFIFGRLHLLPADKFIGGSVRAVGIIVGLAGLLFAAWLMYKMASVGTEASEAAKKTAQEAKIKDILRDANH